MTLFSHRRRRAGFTLIELLTVVAIISLLIGILLPSLSRARDQARTATVAGMLSGIDKALDMFHNDFKQYPDSRLRVDPITGWLDPTGMGVPADNMMLSGAHWLARALVGHDTSGVDANGYVMADGATLALNPPLTYTDLNPNGRYGDRKGIYMEGEIFARDDSGERFPGTAPDAVGYTRRMVVVDEYYDSPVLYYRANVRAQRAFCNVGVATDPLGTYRVQDNERITGKTVTAGGGGPSGSPSVVGWDFAGVGVLPNGLYHPLGQFINSDDPADVHSSPNSFNASLHSESACKAAGKIKPYNAERFILISAGKDGRYGTSDDITNFKPGL